MTACVIALAGLGAGLVVWVCRRLFEGPKAPLVSPRDPRWRE